MTYNGWTNYETWLINLWIDNDLGLYEMVKEWAIQSKSATNLGEMIEQFLLENTPTQGGTLYDDLLSSAIRSADFREIGEHLIEEEEDDKDEEMTEQEHFDVKADLDYDQMIDDSLTD